MAQLLGSRNCIESLHSDIVNLQEAVVDIFSRVGPVRCPSWKYPDKIGCDLDLTQLLDMYDYSEDEEDAQLAHVVLLELVIDRMVLLLQSMSRYLECTVTVGLQKSASPTSRSTSIGLVVKKYWNRMVQLQTAVSHVQAESKKKDQRIADLENTITRLEGYGDEDGHDIAGRDHSGSIPPCSVRTPGSCTPQGISRDESNKSSQTIETAFMPCEACLQVQQSLRTVGDGVTQMCVSEGLPSCLAKYRHQIADVEWMTANDVAHWSAEQNKDLARVTKHLEQLHSTIEPLKGDLAKERRKTNDLGIKLTALAVEVKKEREMQKAQHKQFAAKMRDVERDMAEKVDVKRRENDGLERGKRKLDEQVDQMRMELRRQKDVLTELEVAKSRMTQELSENQTNRSDVGRLDTEVADLTKRLTEVKDQLEGSCKDTAREKAKNVSLVKHNESIQGKQDSLLQRIDSLDRQRESLREETGELVEERERLEEQLGRAEGERARMKEQLLEEQELRKEICRQKESLQGAVGELKGDILEMERKLERAREQERMLVEYPDLNGPVNTDLAGTGDIVKDMENQVTANSVRIGLLQQQNVKLQNTISKIVKSQNRPRQDPILQHAPVPLWKQTDIVTNGDMTPDPHRLARHELLNSTRSGWKEGNKNQSNSNYTTNGRRENTPVKSASNDGQETQQRNFVVGHAPYVANDNRKGRPKSGSRPPSGKSPLATGGVSAGSSIMTYQMLKKEGKLKRPDPHKSGCQRGTVVDDVDSLGSPMVACPKCDRMFTSPDDLDIHRHYCFGDI